MLRQRVTPEEIVKIDQLYAKYGNYATVVGGGIGRSGSTVTRYVKLEGRPEIVKRTF